jgi:hypothetical protein
VNAASIYVVMGQHGEYSDRSEWAVIAFHDEAAAKRHVTLAQDEARRLEAETQREQDERGWIEDADDPKWTNRYDANSQWWPGSCYDASYWYAAVPIGDAVTA